MPTVKKTTTFAEMPASPKLSRTEDETEDGADKMTGFEPHAGLAAAGGVVTLCDKESGEGVVRDW